MAAVMFGATVVTAAILFAIRPAMRRSGIGALQRAASQEFGDPRMQTVARAELAAGQFVVADRTA